MSSGNAVAPFLLGELVNPALHATMNGLELRGLCQAQGAALEQIAEAEERSPTAVAILALVGVLPRPAGRPLGVGLQISTEGLAAVLGRSERMIHYALRELVEAGLVRRFTQIRAVKSITKGRIRSFLYRGRGGWKSTTRAHMTAVLYPTLRGLDLLARHGWTRAAYLGRPSDRRTVRAGVVGFLLENLSSWASAIARRCASVGGHCTPYKSETVRRDPLSRKPGAHAPEEELAPLADGLRRSASTPTGDAPTTARNIGQGAEGGSFEAEVEACWHHSERVGRYANRNPDALGFGYEGRLSDAKATHWAPILSAARWRPAFWRQADAADRAWLERKFEPIRRILAGRIARGEVPA